MTDLATRGWQVVLGDDTTPSASGPTGKTLDVTQVCSGLRYSTRLPGGYADCSWNMAMPFRQAARLLGQLRRVRVFYRGTLAWQGRIEESPAAIEGVGSLPVTALGYSADLHADEFTAIYGASLYDRWKPAAEVVQGQFPLGNLTFYAPGFAGDSNVNPGMCIAYGGGGDYDATYDNVALVWVGVPGCHIRRIRGTVHPWPAANGAILYGFYVVPQGGFSWSTAPSGTQGLASGAMPAIDQVFDVTPSAVPLVADALRFDWQVTTTGTNVSAQGFLVHSLRITSELTAESPSDVPPNAIPLDPQNMDAATVMRSALRWHGSVNVPYPLANFQMTDAGVAGTGGGTVVDQLAFPDATTVEAVVDEVNKAVGYEWGVFDDGFRFASLETITTPGQEALVALGSRAPSNWLVLRQADGHRIAVTRSLELVRNVVRVYYTDASGLPFVVEATDLQNQRNPLNQAGVRRVGSVTIPGTATAAIAAQVGAAFLQQYSRPVVKGTAQLGTSQVMRRRIDAYHQVDQSNWDLVPAPLILPGHWVQLPDTIGMTDQGGRGPFGYASSDTPQSIAAGGVPDSLVPVRGVEVNCDREQVTLTLDTSRDLFTIQLAKLTRGGA